MTGQTVAIAHWRALDREGEDTCRLSRASHGWLLVGHARFRDAFGFAALDYVVRCDDNWRSLSADVAGQHGDLGVQARILREAGRWWLNDIEQPDVAGATDLDLSFTPATNLMPLRRLMAAEQNALNMTAAWLRYPEAVLRPLDQAYRRTGQEGVVTYEARQTGHATQLTVDQSGFVILYPDAWEGEVRHEG